MASRGRTGRKKGAARNRTNGRQPSTNSSGGRPGRSGASGVAEEDQRSGKAPVPGRLTAPVLVLNLNYVPVNVCTVRRAIVLVAKGKAELLEQRAEPSSDPHLQCRSGFPFDHPPRLPGQAAFCPAPPVQEGSVPAGPLHLPILRKAIPATHPRPRGSAPATRTAHVGQRRGRLRTVQPGQGGPHAGGGKHEAAPPADRSAAQPLPHPGKPGDPGRVEAVHPVADGRQVAERQRE